MLAPSTASPTVDGPLLGRGNSGGEVLHGAGRGGAGGVSATTPVAEVVGDGDDGVYGGGSNCSSSNSSSSPSGSSGSRGGPGGGAEGGGESDTGGGVGGGGSPRLSLLCARSDVLWECPFVDPHPGRVDIAELLYPVCSSLLLLVLGFTKAQRTSALTSACPDTRGPCLLLSSPPPPSPNSIAPTLSPEQSCPGSCAAVGTVRDVPAVRACVCAIAEDIISPLWRCVVEASLQSLSLDHRSDTSDAAAVKLHRFHVRRCVLLLLRRISESDASMAASIRDKNGWCVEYCVRALGQCCYCIFHHV